MPDEHSTIEQLLDEAMPVLDAARDFPERDLTFEELGYTYSVLDHILRWDNPEWWRRRGLRFEPLPDDPPLFLAVKATVLAINDHLQAPRVRNPDGVRRSAALALAAITVYRNPVPVEPPPPPEPSVGMFPASIEPLVAIETGPEREPDPAPEVPVFEPYVAMRQFHIGGSQSINVPARSILWIDTTRGLFRFNTPMSVTTYDGSRLPGAIRAGWLLPAEEAQRQERPLERQVVPRGLSDEAYEHVMNLLSMPEMSREGTRRELLRILETPIGQEPQRRVPFILSHESCDRLVALITSGVRPVSGDDMMAFIDQPMPDRPPRQEPDENEVLGLLFDTERASQELNGWRSPLAQAIEDDRQVLRRLGRGQGSEEDQRLGERIRQDILADRHTITREEALEYMFPISRDVPAPALQLSSPWREWADAFREPQQDARRARTAEEQDGIRGPRQLARDGRRALRPSREMTRYRAVTDLSIPTSHGGTAHADAGEEIWWDGAEEGRLRGRPLPAYLMEAYVNRLIEPWPAGVASVKEVEPKTSWAHILDDAGIGDDP